MTTRTGVPLECDIGPLVDGETIVLIHNGAK